jgi:hypothetical protein
MEKMRGELRVESPKRKTAARLETGDPGCVAPADDLYVILPLAYCHAYTFERCEAWNQLRLPAEDVSS